MTQAGNLFRDAQRQAIADTGQIDKIDDFAKWLDRVERNLSGFANLFHGSELNAPLLIRDNISSTVFNSSTGWQIKGDGTATFRTATITGAGGDLVLDDYGLAFVEGTSVAYSGGVRWVSPTATVGSNAWKYGKVFLYGVEPSTGTQNAALQIIAANSGLGETATLSQFLIETGDEIDGNVGVRLLLYSDWLAPTEHYIDLRANRAVSPTGTSFRIGEASVVCNEDGADIDFRVEGDTATNLMVADAGLDAVQIGTTTTGAIADFRATYTALKNLIRLGGTSFPGSPTTNDLYYRTDLGWLCYYDGTRWLTVNEYTNVRTAQSFTIDGNAVQGRLRTDYAPYFTRFAISTHVATTNNATNYWTVTIRSWTTGFGAATTLYTYNTAGDTVTTWTEHDAAPSTANPTSPVFLDLAVAKTLLPGEIMYFLTAFYRLIVT